jgi:hypothetical protein
MMVTVECDCSGFHDAPAEATVTAAEARDTAPTELETLPLNLTSEQPQCQGCLEQFPDDEAKDEHTRTCCAHRDVIVQAKLAAQDRDDGKAAPEESNLTVRSGPMLFDDLASIDAPLDDETAA